MKLRLGFSNYNIKKTTGLIEHGCFGSFDADNKVITIDPEQAEETREQTLWHEVIHGILYEMEEKEIYKDEEFVNMLAKMVHRFLKDNSLEKVYASLR